MFKILYVLVGLFAYAEISAQTSKSIGSKISIRNTRGNLIPFTLQSNPKLTIQNDLLNVAIRSKENDVIELTGIPFSFLKDTLLHTNAYKLIYITPERTWISRGTDKKSTVEIRCSSNEQGKPITLFVNGWVQKGNTQLMIKGTFKGMLPAKTYQTNN